MDKLFSTQEAARYLGVTVRTLKRWQASGKLIPCHSDSHGDRDDKFYSESQLVTVSLPNSQNRDNVDTAKVGTFKLGTPTRDTDKLGTSGDTKETGDNWGHLTRATGDTCNDVPTSTRDTPQPVQSAIGVKRMNDQFDIDQFGEPADEPTGEPVDEPAGERSNEPTDERLADAQKFLNLLFGKVTGEHYGYLWTKQDRRTYPFDVSNAEQRTEMARLAIELADAGKDVYVGVNVGDNAPASSKRLTADNITFQTAVITDIDILGGEHTDPEKYPPNFNTARQFLPFTPSMVVDSGYGLHAYNVYAPPLNITDDNRADAQKRNERFIAAIRRNAGQFSKAVDSVGDLPRILRVPGTKNYKRKDNPAPVRLVEVNDVRFTLADIDERLTAIEPANEPAGEPANEPAGEPVNEPADASKPQNKQSDDPAFDLFRAQKMLDCINPAQLDYDNWFAVNTAAKAIGLSYAVVDAFNKRDSERYNETGNLEKWNEPVNNDFGIKALCSIAKRFDYDAKTVWREWCAQNSKTTAPLSKHLKQQDGTNDSADKHGDSAREPVDEPAIEPTLTNEQRDFLFSGDLSDVDYARRVEFLFGSNIRYLQLEDTWYIFKSLPEGGGFWQSAGEKNSILYPFVRELSDLLKPYVKTESNDALIRKLKDTKKIASTVTALKSLDSLIITKDDLDTHNSLLNVGNGVVDLETGKLLNAAPELLLTQRTPVIYEQYLRNTTVDNFLAAVLPDDRTREALIRYLGYAATGECCEECGIFLNGDGGNGKGTLTQSVTRVFGDYVSTLRPSAILTTGKPQDAGAPTSELTPLENCRLAVVEELPQGGKFDVAKFKNLTGGDFIPIRRLHKEQEVIEPHFSPLFSGNFLPVMNDPRDDGLRRRILVIKFTQSFTGKQRDPSLKKKLATADAQSGLLSIIVEAARDWYRGGLIISADMEDATRDYFDSNDFISEFLSENCTLAPDLSIPRKAFLAKLKEQYPDECGRLFYNRERDLTDAIAKVPGIEYRRSHGTRRFFGVGWKGADEPTNLDFNGATDR